MTEICVVHLVWAPLGVGPFAEFLASYRRFDAGIDHELAIVFNGFADGEVGDEYERELAGLPHRRLVMSGGFDIDAYLLAAREAEAEYVCALNSYSQILVDGWLAKLHRNAAQPGVGIVGTTGSYESMHTNVLLHLGREDRPHVLAARPDLAAQVRDFPPYPNPHIRTNGFLCRRELLVGAANGPMRTKHDTYAFESGHRGLTRQIREQGLAALIVGKDGRGYTENEWFESRTFRSGNQENLLIADNQTRLNLLAEPALRALLRRNAWGDRANPQGDQDLRERFCAAVRDFALAPDDPARRAAVAGSFELLEAAAPPAAAQAELGIETAGVAVLASAIEVADRPELLVAFAETFTAADPVTLVLTAAGGDPAEVERALDPAVEAAGMRLGGSPDAVLLVRELDAAGAELLERSAIACLSDAGVEDADPVCFGPSQLPTLRELIGALRAGGPNGGVQRAA